MFIGVCVSCRISYSDLRYLYVNFSGLITSVREEGAIFCKQLLVIMWFLFRGGSSSFCSLELAVLLYSGSTWAFHIIICFIPWTLPRQT